jgi:zinc transport system ATP-binding protein
MVEEAVVEFRRVHFSYDGRRLLREVSFSVRAGDFGALLGANGSGKSTLLQLLTGELAPQQGAVTLFGEDSRRFTSWPRIGYVAQNSASAAAHFPATAEELVQSALYARRRAERSRKALRAAAERALALVGLESAARMPLRRLSGGQQQRVMLARALAGEPRLMLLDEPTSGLDRESVDGLYQLLRRLRQEAELTLLLVTHDLAGAATLANRIFCLEDASLVELTAEQVLHELQHRRRHPVARRIGEGARLC